MIIITYKEGGVERAFLRGWGRYRFGIWGKGGV